MPLRAMREIVRQWREDVKLHECQDQGGVEECDHQIPGDLPNSIGFELITNCGFSAPLHEHQTQHIGQPVPEDETAGKATPVKAANNPCKSKSQRDVDEKIVPPRKRRQ